MSSSSPQPSQSTEPSKQKTNSKAKAKAQVTPNKGSKAVTTWTPELERDMLMHAVTAADLKPSTQTWDMVAKVMGGGISGSAVSQKFWKMKKAAEKKNSNAHENSITTTASTTSHRSPASQKAKKPAPTVCRNDGAEISGGGDGNAGEDGRNGGNGGNDNDNDNVSGCDGDAAAADATTPPVQGRKRKASSERAS